MQHPRVRGERHDLKEQQRGKQVCGKEHAHQRAERYKIQAAIAIRVRRMGQVFAAEQRRHAPDERDHNRIHAPEPVGLQRDAHSRDPAEQNAVRSLQQQPHGQPKLDRRHGRHADIAKAFAA